MIRRFDIEKAKELLPKGQLFFRGRDNGKSWGNGDRLKGQSQALEVYTNLGMASSLFDLGSLSVQIFVCRSGSHLRIAAERDRPRVVAPILFIHHIYGKSLYICTQDNALLDQIPYESTKKTHTT